MTIQDLRRLCEDAEREQRHEVMIPIDQRLYKNRHEVLPGLYGRVVNRGGGKGIPAEVAVLLPDLRRVLDAVQR